MIPSTSKWAADDETPPRFYDLDAAILGIWEDALTGVSRTAYSGGKILRILQERDQMGLDEAIEFVAFNIEGCYFGPATPIIVWEDLS